MMTSITTVTDYCGGSSLTLVGTVPYNGAGCRSGNATSAGKMNDSNFLKFPASLDAAMSGTTWWVLEHYIYLTGGGAGNGYETILWNTGGAQTELLRMNVSNNALQWNNGIVSTDFGTINTNTCYLIDWVGTATTRKCYINNALVLSDANVGIYGSSTTYIAKANGAAGYYFDGYIDGLVAESGAGSAPTSFPLTYINANTPTSTSTPTVTPTFTNTRTITQTWTNTSTITPTFTATPTWTSTCTITPTFTNTRTVTTTNTPTRTPTPTVTPTNTRVCQNNGTTSITGNLSAGNGTVFFKKVTFSVATTLTNLYAYVPSGSGQIKGAIFGSNNIGFPGSVLFQTSVFYTSVGWNQLSITATSLSPGTYWVGTMVSGSALLRYGRVGTDVFQYKQFGSWPDPAHWQNWLGDAETYAYGCQ